MVKRRKKAIKYETLTDDLEDVIVHGYWLGREMVDVDIDLEDKKLVKEIWDLHKKEIMRRWRLDPKGNAGRRPLFWWFIEAPEPKRDISYEEYKKLELKQHPNIPFKPREKIKKNSPIPQMPPLKYKESNYAYFKRLNLLEDWELKEFERREKVFGKGSVYLRLYDFY